MADGTCTTRDKLLHFAAHATQIARELRALGASVSEGGAPDISFAASHQVGVLISLLDCAAAGLIKLANTL